MDKILKNLRLSKRVDGDRKVVTVKNCKIGGGFVVIAGPCSIESEDQLCETADAVKKSGADILRGGVFKPRTSPYDFQGLGLVGLKILKKAAEQTGLPVITEVTDPRNVEWASEYVDILQVGARNMSNFPLLKEMGKTKKPILIKRGMNSTISEWLNSAEYVLNEGNPDVILCERGIRTFEPLTRNTMDLSGIAVAKRLTNLPVIADPSHATGIRDLVEIMSLASVAVGADGLMIEVHRNPEEAKSDKDQTLTCGQFDTLIKKARTLRKLVEGFYEDL